MKAGSGICMGSVLIALAALAAGCSSSDRDEQAAAPENSAPGRQVYLDAEGNPTTPPPGTVIPGAEVSPGEKAKPRQVKMPDGRIRTVVPGPQVSIEARVNSDGKLVYECSASECTDPAHQHADDAGQPGNGEAANHAN